MKKKILIILMSILLIMSLFAETTILSKSDPINTSDGFTSSYILVKNYDSFNNNTTYYWYDVVFGFNSKIEKVYLAFILNKDGLPTGFSSTVFSSDFYASCNQILIKFSDIYTFDCEYSSLDVDTSSKYLYQIVGISEDITKDLVTKISNYKNKEVQIRIVLEGKNIDLTVPAYYFIQAFSFYSANNKSNNS